MIQFVRESNDSSPPIRSRLFLKSQINQLFLVVMLTALTVKNASCPEGQHHARLHDGNGLYLEVRRLKRTAGFSKTWYYKFRMNGVESRATLGSYPEVSLTLAREKRSDVAKGVRQKIHPKLSPAKVVDTTPKQAITFRDVAEDWFKNRSPRWSQSHSTREKRNLEKDLYPELESKPIGEITASDVLKAAQGAEKRGSLDVAHRIAKTARGVFEFAIACGHIQINPAAATRNALRKHSKKHYSAITQPTVFGKMLNAIDAYKGGEIVRTALKLTLMFFQRPTELREAKWTEFDFQNNLWTVPARRMKREFDGKAHGDDHIVPIPTQAVDLLMHLKKHSRGSEYLFPSIRSRTRPISDGTLRAALQTLGFSGDLQTVHGFRASARTMIDERLKFDPRVIEAQLAHSVKDTQGGAYNRTKFVQQRKKMMQAWADYIDQMRMGLITDDTLEDDSQ